jgi:hypothetical protein
MPPVIHRRRRRLSCSKCGKDSWLSVYEEIRDTPCRSCQSLSLIPLSKKGQPTTPNLLDYGLNAQRSTAAEKVVNKILFLCGVLGCSITAYLIFLLAQAKSVLTVGAVIQITACGFLVFIFSTLACGAITSVGFGLFEEIAASLGYSTDHYRLGLFKAALRDFAHYQNIRWEDEQRRNADYWWSLGGLQFEQELAGLWRKIGCSALVTQASGDGGIDIVLTENGVRIAVQCKAHKGSVGPSVVRELLGASHASGFQRAILVALGGATPGALRFAAENGIAIMDISDVLKLQGRAYPPDSTGKR